VLSQEKVEKHCVEQGVKLCTSGQTWPAVQLYLAR